MSSNIPRRTKVAKRKDKEVSTNYLMFLWSQIGQIRQVQQQGNLAGAMKMVASLIPYLPKSIKNEFREKVLQIERSMEIIRAGKVPQIQKIPDFYLRGIFKNRLLQTYANEAFNQVMDELSSKLDDLGYMEKPASEVDTQ